LAKWRLECTTDGVGKRLCETRRGAAAGVRDKLNVNDGHAA
jgi:hypothetical protein